MLSEAKHLCAQQDRCFASLSMTMCDCSHCQGLFFTIEPCLNLANTYAVPSTPPPPTPLHRSPLPERRDPAGLRDCTPPVRAETARKCGLRRRWYRHVTQLIRSRPRDRLSCGRGATWSAIQRCSVGARSERDVESTAQPVQRVLQQPMSGHTPAPQRMMRLVGQAEIARRACRRHVTTLSEAPHEVRLTDERPCHRDEIGIAAREDPLHRFTTPHSSDQDDRAVDVTAQRPCGVGKVCLGCRWREHTLWQPVEQRAPRSDS